MENYANLDTHVLFVSTVTPPLSPPSLWILSLISFSLSLSLSLSCFLFPSSRGGVLEAEGTVEIKFRRKDLLKTMRRIDRAYADLADQLGKFTKLC